MGTARRTGDDHVRFALTAVLLASLALPAMAAELVMVSTRGCSYCAAWEREVGVAYPRSAEAARAPLRHVDFRDTKSLPVETPVQYTPTFILIEDGRERGRITGYHDAGMFWGLLSGLLTQLDASATGPGR